MATMTVTVPDAALPRILDAFAAVYRWDPESGLTKAEFARRQVAEFVRRTVIENEQPARRAAAQSLLRGEVDGLGVS